jgi:D-arabinose 1-dehydrogenase-like Zn-dependent alcohol dehydrogenase
VDLRRVFALQLEILGSSMGTPQELADLLDLCAAGPRPVIDSVFAFTDVRAAFERLRDGAVFGKIVLDHAR